MAGSGRRRAGSRIVACGEIALPRVPEGDIVVALEAAFRASYAFGAKVERLDARLRQWPAAALSLLAIAIVLGAAMLAGH